LARRLTKRRRKIREGWNSVIPPWCAGSPPPAYGHDRMRAGRPANLQSAVSNAHAGGSNGAQVIQADDPAAIAQRLIDAFNKLEPDGMAAMAIG
jgi:hypothetical protein